MMLETGDRISMSGMSVRVLQGNRGTADRIVTRGTAHLGYEAVEAQITC
jgi:hypothetical protein